VRFDPEQLVYAMHKSARAITFILLLLNGQCGTLGRSPERFIVAIVRQDGIVVPFASYSHGKWSNPWPNPDQDLDLKVSSLDKVPEAWLDASPRISRTWFEHSASISAQPLTVVKVVQFEAHCQRQWGLFPAKAVQPTPSYHCGFPNPAIAIDTPLEVESMVRLTPKDIEARRLLATLQPFINQMESAQVETAAREQSVREGRLRYSGHPLDVAERRKIPVTLTKVYRTQTEIQGSWTYYVEAEKRYPNGCPALTLWGGWVMKDSSGRLTPVGDGVAVTDCDAKGVNFSEPMGALLVQGQNFIVMQSHGWEDETYSILKVSKFQIKPALTVRGGGC
jgi:hypothetical protein